MRILYIGDGQPVNTSFHRAAALRRIGHEVIHVDPRAKLPSWRIVGGISTRIGLWPFAPWINSTLRQSVGGAQFDLAWVDGGAELSPSFHRWLKRRGIKIVNYNCDDPFGSRDGRKWDMYRRSVCIHDATVVVRAENIPEAKACGAKKVMHVFRSYDPVAHAPCVLGEEDRQRWSSEVVFVGSWMPERGPFMLQLVEAGIPLSIWGDHWQHAPEWEQLHSIVRGPAAVGTNYVKSLQCAKIALGLLSKGNRDLHTQRSAEVPFIGGPVFCAERTTEHEKMYREGTQALFWSSAAECARKCHAILADEERRSCMAAAARARVLQLGLSNDSIVSWVLDSLTANSSTLSRDLRAN